MQEFTIDAEAAGERADVFIARQYPQFARAALSKLFDAHITLNGKPGKAGYKLRAGDHLTVDTSHLTADPPPIDLPIIYEDDDVIVIDKPSGVLTHSKGGFLDEGTVASFLRDRLTQDMDRQNNRAGIVHRLDRATSGLIICAKSSAALAKLQQQFAQRKAKKTYVAIVAGTPPEPAALIDAPIERNPASPHTFRVSAHGKPAQTYYQTLKTANGRSMLELRPVTGRTHQLRVHLKYLGHPIVGDAVYGGPAAGRLLLHASCLEVTLPGGERQIFESPLPEVFIQELGGDA